MEMEIRVLILNSGLLLLEYIQRFIVTFYHFTSVSIYIMTYLLCGQVVHYKSDTAGRVLYEYTSCISLMLCRMASSLRVPEGQNEEISNNILDHARQSGIPDLLIECLMTSGSSMISGSSDMLPAACEACKSIWYLIDGIETLSLNGRNIVFPLILSKGNLMFQYDLQDRSQCSCHETVSVVANSFLESKSVQVAVYYCFRNGLESALHAVLQVILLSS